MLKKCSEFRHFLKIGYSTLGVDKKRTEFQGVSRTLALINIINTPYYNHTYQ